MIPLKSRRFWRTTRQLAMGILMCFGVLGIVPKAYAQTDRVDLLIRQLMDKGTTVREKAAEALGELKDPRSVKPLVAALDDMDFVVRRTTVAALVKIGSPAVDPLIFALNRPDSVVKYNAAQALGQIKDSRAVGPLIFALTRSDSVLKYYAAQALG